MKTTMMVGGSRKITELPQKAIEALNQAIKSQVLIIVGDCHGVDTAVQHYLKLKHYKRVFVFHIGKEPRNNVGNFRTVWCLGGKQSFKDDMMLNRADMGLFIFNGKSPGTRRNIQRMKEMQKPIETII